MSNNTFKNKFVGRVFVGPVVGLVRGVLGLISFNSIVFSSIVTTSIMLLPVGASISMIAFTISALNISYNLLKGIVLHPGSSRTR